MFHDNDTGSGAADFDMPRAGMQGQPEAAAGLVICMSWGRINQP